MWGFVVGNISELVGRLRDLLQQVVCTEPGRKRVTLPLTSIQHASLLDWLSAQTIFPQFYWMHRDGSEETAVCGEIIHFEDIAQANEFIQQAPQCKMRIWGLNAFDQLDPLERTNAKAFLFLPRFEFSISQEQASFSINLFSLHSLADDAQTAISLLADLRCPIAPQAMAVEVTSVQHMPEKAQWIGMLNKALFEIENKHFEKVVLARRTLLKLDHKLKPIQFISASQKVNHHCYHFMLALDEYRGFLGSTPERLFYRDGFQLKTEALAGTVSGADDNDEAQELANWLLNDQKNQHENLLVVNDIRQRLHGVALALDVKPAEVIRLRKVQHLYRAIQATLSVNDDADCLTRLQPTAAVAGLPRKPALRFILEHEPFERNWYAGSAGYMSFDKTELVVALRSAQIDNRQVYLYAGAGIVAGSDPLYEWLEIENKAAGLRSLLQESK